MAEADTTVTPEEIKLFKTTLLARRFPGLKDLDDQRITELILAQRQATGKLQEVPRKQYPKTQFRPPAPKRDVLRFEKPCIFVPCNPVEAKETVKRKPEEAFVGVYSPYAADHEEFAHFKTTDESKRPPQEPFVPSSPSKARTLIEVNYFLTSADADTLVAEKQAILHRSLENKAAFKSLTDSRRGGMLV